jgi:hypothetical protein
VQLVLELRVGLLDLPGAGAHGARHPVQRAELVDDRALDAGDGERLELDLAREVESLDRRDKPEQAVGDEVGLLDVGRQSRRHAAGHVLDQGRERQHELLARPLVVLLLVLAPELAHLDALDVRVQGFSSALGGLVPRPKALRLYAM